MALPLTGGDGDGMDSVSRGSWSRHVVVDATTDDGFTLIELMVVLLIMAILLAIAIPIFLGAKGSSSDRATQSNLSAAATSAASYYASNQSFSTATTALLTAADPAYAWTLATTAGSGVCNSASPANCISFAPIDVAALGDGQGIMFAAYAKPTDTCWYEVVLETNVALVTGDTEPPFAFSRYSLATSDPQLGSATLSSQLVSAGTYYAKKTSIGSTGDCSIYWAATQAPLYWGSSYANAGVN